MTTYPPNKPRKPLGALPPLTDDQLAQMAEVTPLDIETAAALWRSAVKPIYKNLLDAKAVDVTNKPANA